MDGAQRRRDRPMKTELTATQREALERFKTKQGRYWKSRLVALWINGRDDRAEDGAGGDVETAGRRALGELGRLHPPTHRNRRARDARRGAELVHRLNLRPKLHPVAGLIEQTHPAHPRQLHVNPTGIVPAGVGRAVARPNSSRHSAGHHQPSTPFSRR